MPKHKLQKTTKSYPTIIAVMGRASENKTNAYLTTKRPMRQKKKRFGIFTKSEE